MAEKYKLKRVSFSKGQQQKFLFQAKEKLKVPWRKIADIAGVSERTLTDWKREKFTMNIKAALLLSKISKVQLPPHKTKDPYWYVGKGAKIGGFAVLEKYGHIGGDPEQRKKKWREWWEREGKHKSHPIINVALPIYKPRRSERLAEFVGIMLGDGGISKNQLTVTLHRYNDKDYITYVAKLIKDLFHVSPSIYHDKKAKVSNIVVSRVRLVKFCTEKLGLKIGSKVRQQVDVPSWIKKNNKYYTSCVRGLVDTGGCAFTHCYSVNGKRYCYKKLAFSNRSKPLRESIYSFLKNLGFSPRIAYDKKVRLENHINVENYFRIVGTNNPKHLRRLGA